MCFQLPKIVVRSQWSVLRSQILVVETNSKAFNAEIAKIAENYGAGYFSAYFAISALIALVLVLIGGLSGGGDLIYV